MRAVTVACLVLLLTVTAVAEMSLDERVDILWDRAVRQTDFAKWDEALETGRHAVQVAPESADAWALMAYTHWMHPQGLEYLAQGQVQRALGLDPQSARARMVSGLVIPFVTDPPDFERSIRELERAVELDPGLARAWARLGLTRLDSGDAENSVPDLRRAVDLQPDYYEWPMNLAESLSAVGQQEESVAAARRAVGLSFSEFSEQLARNNLAWEICLLMPADRAQRDEAIDNAEQSALLAPADPEILDTLGTAEVLFGEPDVAEVAFRSAIEHGNNSWGGLGYALALQGKADEARQALAAYSDEWLAERAGAHDAYLAGLAWEALEERQIARRVFDAAVRKWPDHPWSDEMQEWLGAAGGP